MANVTRRLRCLRMQLRLGCTGRPRLRAGSRAGQMILALTIALLAASSFCLPAQADACTPLPPYGSESDRFGLNVVTDYGKTLSDYNAAPLQAGWYLDYQVQSHSIVPAAPNTAGVSALTPLTMQAANQVYLPLVANRKQSYGASGMAYVPVLRVSDLMSTGWQSWLGPLIDANLGALWVVGNEPDRSFQDGKPPDVYAQIYHDTYWFIKQRDPTSKVAIAGVVQATPLRLRYLDMVLDEYQRRYGARLPTDVWNVHGFILREANKKVDGQEPWGAGSRRVWMPMPAKGSSTTCPMSAIWRSSSSRSWPFAAGWPIAVTATGR